MEIIKFNNLWLRRKLTLGAYLFMDDPAFWIETNYIHWYINESCLTLSKWGKGHFYRVLNKDKNISDAQEFSVIFESV